MINTPALTTLYINPASGCNLHCQHCWVNEGTECGEQISLDNWIDLLSQANSIGCEYVKFTGGEPLLFPNFLALYEFAYDNFRKVTIETNGTLQSEKLWKVFSRKNPYHVSVSIDDADSSVHDDFRGIKGSWAKSVNFVRNLVTYNINNQIITSIYTPNRVKILNMIELCKEIGAYTLKINLVFPAGRSDKNNFYSDNSISDILDFFNWITGSTPEWVVPSIPAAFIPVNRLRLHGYCPVKNLMTVLPDGTFSLCGIAFTREGFSWGRFPEVSVNEAWNHSPVYKKVRETIPDKLSGVCELCIHRTTCIGKCIVNNLIIRGSISSPDDLCQRAYEANLFPETRLAIKG